jgi:dUTP pyrophosphatase
MAEEELSVPVRHLNPAMPLPRRARIGDAAVDLIAAEPLELLPGARGVVPTGLQLAVPIGHVGLVLPRSGLALRHGVTVLNAPGCIDPGYRGEVGVILINHDPVQTYNVNRGDRVAQLLIIGFEAFAWVVVNDLGNTDRGVSGFGSSGT